MLLATFLDILFHAVFLYRYKPTPRLNKIIDDFNFQAPSILLFSYSGCRQGKWKKRRRYGHTDMVIS